jgi:hypothetical protein
MLTDALKLARFYWCLLAICTVGRVGLGIAHVPYERGHHLFSLVTLTIFGAVFYGAFGRRWRGMSIHEVAMLGLLLGLGTQVVIFVATIVSYALGVHTYFNDPTPLGSTVAVPWATAMARRFGGLVANSILAAILATMGWALGPLLPEKR